MKRIFTFALTFAVVFCLTACSMPKGGSSSRRNGLDSAFSAAVSITLDRLEAEGEMKRFGDGVWEIEFSEPNTLSGVKLEFSEGSVVASYKGLAFSVPQSALPMKAMMLNLMRAVDENAKLEELSGEAEGDMLKISGRLDGGDYTLTVDGEGRLCGFEMPNNKLTMKLSDIRTADIADASTEPSAEAVTETASETASEEVTTSC